MMGEAIAHHGVVVSGEIAIGERVRTVVFDWWRREIRRHHTSAHLLQRALKDVLGDEVNQAGSWVGAIACDSISAGRAARCRPNKSVRSRIASTR